MQGKTITEAVELMRGVVGTKIEITVRRIGVRKAFIFEIVRDIIEVKSVKSKVIDNNVGYIRLTSFNDNSASDQIKQKIKELKKKKKLKNIF